MKKKVDKKLSPPLDQFSPEILEKYVGNIERFKTIFTELNGKNIGSLREAFFELYEEVNGRLICYRDRHGNIVDRTHPHVSLIDELKAQGLNHFEFGSNEYDLKLEEAIAKEETYNSTIGSCGSWSPEEMTKIDKEINEIAGITTAINDLYWDYENTIKGKIKCFFVKLFGKYVTKEAMLKEHLGWAYSTKGLFEEEMHNV